MYIVNESYFSQELIRPESGTELYTATNNNPFEAWIDEYARLLIQNALGNVLFAEFDSEVTSGVLDSGADQKWKNLVNGTTYTYNGKSYTWRGLIYQEGLAYKSLLADYVFAEWYKYQLSHLSNFGEVAGNSINSILVGGNAREYRVWNQFVRAYQGNHKYYNDYLEYWKRFDRQLYYDVLLGRTVLINDTGYVSMVDFMTHNETDYLDAPKKLYGLKNFASI